MNKRPKKGDHVKVFDHMHDVFLYGVVEDLLSKQFTYITTQGATRFCFYDGLWEVRDEG
jgi:hypothetical protein